MAPSYVYTLRDLIYYEYSKMISISVKGEVDYHFIWNRYSRFKKGQMNMSTTLREWEREQEKLEKKCVYCSSNENLSTDHIIPISIGGSDSPDNLIIACKKCNSSKNDIPLFTWMSRNGYWPNTNYLDRILTGKYLKQLYVLHEKNGTLDINRKQMDELCKACLISEECTKWKREHTITPLCLESILFR